MENQRNQYVVVSRMLHWILAAMVLTMLCIGVAMVTSVANYHLFVSIHRPLGIAILFLVVVQLVNRLVNPPPPFPPTIGPMERLVASVGWGMLSAARSPVVLYGSLHLPFILPHNAKLYAVLREAHTVLAYFFFLTFLVHFGVILFHTLILKDGILRRMAPWSIRPQEAGPHL